MKPDPHMHTEDEAFHIASLIAGYIKGSLSSPEQKELDGWVEASDDNMRLFEELTDERNTDRAMAYFKSVNVDAAYNKLKAKIPFESPAKKTWPKFLSIAVAASIILIVTLFWFNRNHTQPHEEQFAEQPVNPSSDVAPGTNKATLVLANGHSIALDETHKGVLAKEEGVSIEHTNGSLQYVGNNADNLSTNTINVPRGGQYKVQLSDGTTVWLNAASSITYPVSFNGGDRKITLHGEAYFDVAVNPHQPFLVQTDDMVITVLGTRFNMRCYAEDHTSVATLVSGKIKVSAGGKTTELVPNKEAVLSNNQLSITDADTSESIAWKNGNFNFKGETIESVMQQVVRWYDVQIIYKQKIDKHFTAEISRDVPLSKLLGLLQKTSSVHFTIDNQTIIVSQ